MLSKVASSTGRIRSNSVRTARLPGGPESKQVRLSLILKTTLYRTNSVGQVGLIGRDQG